MFDVSRLVLSASGIGLLIGVLGCQPAALAPSTPSITAPPVHAGFDYQIGKPYAPPADVQVISRDHDANTAAGLHNICYLNAFQAQPGAEGNWDPDLLLRNSDGDIIIDQDWHEALLDLRTDDKRKRIVTRVEGWIDQCASKGFNGIEPDNYDSYTRSVGLLTADDAQAFIRLLSAHAHERGVAIGQKNTAELADAAKSNGLDFAIAEECAEHQECADYATAFDDKVVVIEYTDDGLTQACAQWGGRLSIVERDRNVTGPGSDDYVRRTCRGPHSARP